MSKYQERFTLVINFIEANLDEDLDVEKLCKLACFSKYHFHRQCSVFIGMSVMSLTRLLRLKRAAYRLAYRDDLVIDIALDSGYESHEAFSRIFKKYFHKSPSDFRKQPDWTPWHSIYEPISTLRIKIMQTTPEVRIVDFPNTAIAVMEHRGAPDLLPSTIQQFIQWRKANGLPPRKSRTFNLVYDDPNTTAPEDYRVDLGCSVETAIEKTETGVVNKTIPEGKCALVRHQGSDDTLGAIVYFLYAEWLENSPYELRDFPVFFERISFFPDVPENETITDIYLPIR
jgi:AraC family transcriptional regulator